MGTLYGWLVLLHVVAAIAWVGGAGALAVVTARMLRSGAGAGFAEFLKSANAYGMTVVGPATVLVLASGIWMAVIRRTFGLLWVEIGLAGIVLHIVIGVGLTSRVNRRLVTLLAQPQPDQTLALAAGRRLRLLNGIYLLVLLVVVAVMVLKPA